MSRKNFEFTNFNHLLLYMVCETLCLHNVVFARKRILISIQHLKLLQSYNKADQILSLYNKMNKVVYKTTPSFQALGLKKVGSKPKTRKKKKNQSLYTENKHHENTSCGTVSCQRDARDQKLKRKEGKAANQLMKANAVDVSNWTQWFCAQLFRSLSIRTVMPADAQAAAKVSVDVTWNNVKKMLIYPHLFPRTILTDREAKWLISYPITNCKQAHKSTVL